jgi:hypothetical protein
MRPDALERLRVQARAVETRLLSGRVTNATGTIIRPVPRACT